MGRNHDEQVEEEAAMVSEAAKQDRYRISQIANTNLRIFQEILSAPLSEARAVYSLLPLTPGAVPPWMARGIGWKAVQVSRSASATDLKIVKSSTEMVIASYIGHACRDFPRKFQFGLMVQVGRMFHGRLVKQVWEEVKRVGDQLREREAELTLQGAPHWVVYSIPLRKYRSW